MTTQTFSLGPDPKLEVEHVNGDVILEGWERAELQAQGDNIHIEPSDDTMNISSDGDLKLTIPRGTRLTVSFVGGDLKAENLDGLIDVSFIGGDAVLRNLKGQVSFNGMVGGDINLENVSKVSIDANKHGVGPDISAHVRHKVDQAARRAEQKLRRAEGKIKMAEHKLHRYGQIGANVDVGRWKWNVTPDTVQPGGANEPVTDQERMSILKMLQDKKITSEQADKLLAALEGGE